MSSTTAPAAPSAYEAQTGMPAPTRLPAALRGVRVDLVEDTSLGGFTVTLSRQGQHLGSLVNTGHGAGTYFHGADADRLFREAAESFRPVAAEIEASWLEDFADDADDASVTAADLDASRAREILGDALYLYALPRPRGRFVVPATAGQAA